jgi:Rad52/22 family double-strand break repair protein
MFDTEDGANMSTTIEQRLTESPGPMSRHPHTGANYHEADQIITHLNYALGPFGWDWTTGEHGYDEQADEVYVIGTLTARALVQTADGEAWQTTSKTERGWQPVNRKKTGEALSFGNDYKGADTDALKRAARLLGVGLDAWAKTTAAGSSPRPTPASRPQPSTHETERARQLVAAIPDSAERPELLTAYATLVAQAKAHGYSGAFVGDDPTRFTDVQLRKYAELLTAYLARQEHVA